MRRISLAFSLFVLVLGRSFPVDTSCDAEDQTLGWREPGETAEDGHIMWWSKAAVRTDAYTLRTGDSCGGDPTSYVPGEMMGIHLRTHKYKGQFRGLLIYAVSVSDKKRVGDWELAWPNSNMFWKPAGACQNVSLMHLNGAEKYYHHKFMWKAPPAGTGTVEFHALIKRGEANLGEFYWPNLAGNLQLTEGGASASNKWVQGAVGSDCSTTCTNQGLSCDANLHDKAYTWGGLLQRDVLNTALCNTPALESQVPTIYKDEFGWCHYPSNSTVPATGTCSLGSPAGTSPICSCGSAGQPSSRIFAAPDTACLNGYVAMGSASRASSSLVSIALMLLATFWFHQPRKSSSVLFLGLVLGCAQVAQAHNWVYAVSRSFDQASTYKPCRPKVNDSPHWQINPGQTFNMEWATGHDWYFYFTVVRASDIDYMNNITDDDLDEYVKGCTDSDNYMKADPAFWMKQHIGGPNMNGFDGLPIYSRNISTTDPAYIKRHAKFGPLNNEVRWLYSTPNVDKDIRCHKFHAKYPYIIAVHRFVQVQTMDSRAGDRDIARFTIELSPQHQANGYGEGSYILQYLWRGYFDCADVDLFIGSATIDPLEIGGVPLEEGDPQWNKVDHCQFEDIQGVRGQCMEVVTTPDTLLTRCLGDTGCDGVNVVPLWLPSDVYPLFSDRVGVQWRDDSNAMMGGGCTKDLFASLGKDTLVGYGLTARQANNTHSQYSVTDDPEDPLFYSTCWIKKPQWKFTQHLPNQNQTVTYTPPPWSFSDRCVDCQSWKDAQTTDIVPRWSPLPQSCRNCQQENISSQVAPINILSRGQKCDGSWSTQTVWTFPPPNPGCATTRCVKSLALVGVTSGMTAEQCIAKAKLDPECSEHVQLNANAGSRCECWVKNPTCCGTCKPVDTIYANWQYNVYSTATPSGDPNCTNGKKSDDGAHCCPASCDACLSKPVFQVAFRSNSLNPALLPGWAIDGGEPYGARTPVAGQAYSTYGWNCDLTDSTYDRDANSNEGNRANEAKNYVGHNYRQTAIRADPNECGKTPEWNVLVSNGTQDFEVHTLYTIVNGRISGCLLNNEANVDNITNIGNSAIEWVVRKVTPTNGKITWSGSSDSNCAGISAMRIYSPPSSANPVDCQTMSGMCCPQFLDMASRPCTSFPAPCSL